MLQFNKANNTGAIAFAASAVQAIEAAGEQTIVYLAGHSVALAAKVEDVIAEVEEEISSYQAAHKPAEAPAPAPIGGK